MTHHRPGEQGTGESQGRAVEAQLRVSGRAEATAKTAGGAATWVINGGGEVVLSK